MAENEKKPVFKGKQTARRIRSIIPYMAATPYIMKHRDDSQNFFQDSIEVTETDAFLRRKRDEGMKGLGYLHLLIAAYVRTVSQNPALNRFIRGQRAYANRYITVVMTVKESMAQDASETSIKVIFDPRDTIEDVYNKMNAAISSVKAGNETATGDIANLLFKSVPRFILRGIVDILRLLDYYGLMPKVIENASPFHGSMIITDMGSLGIPPIYHHLYNFGHLPLFLSFGARRRTYEVTRSGEVAARRYIDLNVVTDERICDGYTYAQCFKMMRRLITHPEQLETPPEKVVEDIY